MRRKRYYNEPCDLLLKKFQPQLQQVYRLYSGKENALGEPKRVSISEWIQLTERAGFVDDVFTMREVKLSYLRAQETAVDEQDSDQHRKMAFVEFIEALARVADMKDLSFGAVDKSLVSAFDEDTDSDDEFAEVAWEHGRPGLGPLVERLMKIIDALLFLLDRVPGGSIRKGSAVALHQQLANKGASWRRGSAIQLLDRGATIIE
jgi:hypothetical protein